MNQPQKCGMCTYYVYILLNTLVLFGIMNSVNHNIITLDMLEVNIH